MTDRKTVQIVVMFLGVIALVGLLAITYLIDHDAPAEAVAILAAISSGALGALGGLLTNSSSVDPAKMEERIRNEAMADVASLALEQPAPVVVADTAEVAVQVAAGDGLTGQTNEADRRAELGLDGEPEDDLGLYDYEDPDDNPRDDDSVGG